MKKIFLKLLCASLAVLTFAACAPDTTVEPADTTPEDTNQNPVESNPSIDVMKFELSEYVTTPELSSITLTHNVYCDDETLEGLLSDFAKDSGFVKKVTDRVTKEGDTLNISYAGRIGDVYFDRGTAESASVTLVENNGYIDGFADDLYGIMPGTKVETEVTFPEDYATASLAGATAIFEITVNYICDYYLTDAEVKSISDGKYETVEAFAKYVRESTILENLKNYESNLFNALKAKLVESCEIKEYPSELTYYYYNDIISYYQQTADSYGLSLDTLLAYYGMNIQDIVVMSMQYSKEDLALHALFVKCGLVLSESDYRIKLTELALSYGYASADVLEAQYGEFFLKNMMRNDMCVEYMLENITIETDYDQYKHLLETESTTTAGETN